MGVLCDSEPFSNNKFSLTEGNVPPILISFYLTSHRPASPLLGMLSPISSLIVPSSHLPTPPHPLSTPQNIASKCASVGMCNEASAALVKCNMIKEAVDCCVALNQWDQAVKIAHDHNMGSVDELLAKYAAHLLEKGG